MNEITPPSGDNVRDIPFGDALSERYLSYALSTIMARSLPDVRDGMKPVHRRLLYAMQQLRLDPNGGYKKCARVVGDVMGKFHPHGDQSIYDALVRLAQDFAVRYPLIDGQGNFGNIDGDNAAAMRYTESRLTHVGEALLEGLDQDAIDFRPTYDGLDEEPLVLPAGFPNLLANGSQGIAVGMATSIPPHNVDELSLAMQHLLAHPDASVTELLVHVKGPDFPTGGICVEPADSIARAYETGRGGFRLRARWEIEDQGRGTYVLVVTEIPYQVQKSKLIEKIADLINNRKLAALLADVRDESTDKVRIVLEPRSRTVDPDVLMESLFKLTDLETRVSLNLNVLDKDQTPRVMSLKEALQAYIDHRIEVLVRRSRFRLGNIERRMEILRGYLIVFLNLDEVIAIIRREDEPKPVLMSQFELSDLQAEAILNMRLRSLRRLEEEGIIKEYSGLEGEQADLTALIDSPVLQRKAIGKELDSLRQRFGKTTELGARRTTFAEAGEAVVVSAEALIEKEPVTVILSRMGWIRAMKGHIDRGAEIKFKDGDGPAFAVHAQTTDKLLLFASNGRFYTLGCDKLPGGRGMGEPVRLMIDLPATDDIVVAMTYVPDMKLLVASSDGRGFIVDAASVLAQTKNGKQVLNVDAPTRARICIPAAGDSVAVVGENRKILIFARDELPEMTRGKGVALQKYRGGGLSDVKVFNLSEGLTWASGERTRTETDVTEWIGRRGQSGRMAPRGFAANNRFS
ncbi:DNA topoisomerase IV subunit A [Iodidimonas sp. SYSU 1G8]|uniref:DNA topoisomerase IV subunit A n=1 Tax=Iodidimonas sp. SYSU 1G8 TaxID=3133967 RepID=UPI0031FEA0E1